MSGNLATAAAPIWRHSLQFGACALVAALLLALAWRLTRDRIDYHQHDSERSALNEVMPAALHDNDLLMARFPLTSATDYQQLALLGLSISRSGYLAMKDGTPSGVILPLETRGFGGAMVMNVGIDSDGNITGVRVLQHKETPGFGDKIDISQSLWITSFDHTNLQDTPEPLWHVKKEGGDFDQFTGATITPRAVVAAVHNALVFFDVNKDKLLMKQPGSDRQ
jgi:electron transport complex protein RnfG